MRLCQAVNLTFADSKEQLLIGLHSESLVNNLLAKSHQSEDELLRSVSTFNRVKQSCVSRINSTIGNHNHGARPANFSTSRKLLETPLHQ